MCAPRWRSLSESVSVKLPVRWPPDRSVCPRPTTDHRTLAPCLLLCPPHHPPREQVLSLRALGRPDGAPIEVLAVALALVTLDVRSGGVRDALEPWVRRVLADAADYEDHRAWSAPESWRRDAQWVVGQLRRALSTCKN